MRKSLETVLFLWKTLGTLKMTIHNYSSNDDLIYKFRFHKTYLTNEILELNQ